MRSDDLPRIQARDVKHANDINRRITEWKAELRRIYPKAPDEEILRLACAYVADGVPCPEKTK